MAVFALGWSHNMYISNFLLLSSCRLTNKPVRDTFFLKGYVYNVLNGPINGLGFYKFH